MSAWIIDGKRSRLRNHQVLECGRRVHANGLREDVMVRCLNDWRGWWDYLQQRTVLSSQGRDE
jgi:site-specific recombinase XerC